MSESRPTRNETAALWAEAARLLDGGTSSALATVSKQRGSLPMAGDAKMLVTADGLRCGTVGGGCVEAEVVQQALATMEQETPAFVQHSLNADIAGDVGLSCGGTVELFLEPLLPNEELALLCNSVASGIEQRSPVTVLTGLQWSGGPVKAAQVGQECVWVGKGSRALEPSRYELHRGHALVDRDHSVFVEKIPRVPRVIILGAGHVGAAIAKIAAEVGFYVVVADDREEFANRERFPTANEIIADDFNAVLDGFSFDADDYVLATTRGHAFDALVVQRAAASKAGYVGMLGSLRKRAVVWKALLAAGVPSDALDRVHTPMGLAIGADTPMEIAVSIVGELIQARRLAAESGD